MKKFVLVLAIAMIVSGAAWAQSTQITGPELTWPAAPPSLQYEDSTDRGVLPRFSAVPTTSTESRYSMGRFGSDVDDFIDPVWHNAQIGTFIFAGGFPGGVTPNTTALTSAARGAGDSDAISLGFGKTIGEDKYLGIYYGGYLVDAESFHNDKEHGGNPDNKEFDWSETRWRNKLAVLFGMPSIGGIRLDLIMSNTTSFRNAVTGETFNESITGAPEIDLSWGKLMGKFAPYLTLGFKFPDTVVYTGGGDLETAPDKKVTESSDAKLGLKAGVWLETGETTSVVAELMIGGTFPTTYRGDVKDVPHAQGGTISSTDEWETGGAFAADLHVHLQKELTFGDVTVKLRPRLGINYISESTNSTWNGNKDKSPSHDWFTLTTGLDLGVRYAYDKIALYTGAGLNFFKWETYAELGGDDERKDSLSRFTGINWDASSVTTSSSVGIGTLGFGLTFAPIQGLVLGTGITLASINPVTMQIDPGAQPDLSKPSEQGYSFWGSSALHITLSYAFK